MDRNVFYAFYSVSCFFFFCLIYLGHFFISLNVDSCHHFNISERWVLNWRFSKAPLMKWHLNRLDQEAETVVTAFSAEGTVWTSKYSQWQTTLPTRSQPLRNTGTGTQREEVVLPGSYRELVLRVQLEPRTLLTPSPGLGPLQSPVHGLHIGTEALPHLVLIHFHYLNCRWQPIMDHALPWLHRQTAKSRPIEGRAVWGHWARG